MPASQVADGHAARKSHKHEETKALCHKEEMDKGRKYNNCTKTNGSQIGFGWTLKPNFPLLQVFSKEQFSLFHNGLVCFTIFFLVYVAHLHLCLLFRFVVVFPDLCSIQGCCDC